MAFVESGATGNRSGVIFPQERFFGTPSRIGPGQLFKIAVPFIGARHLQIQLLQISGVHAGSGDIFN